MRLLILAVWLAASRALDCPEQCACGLAYVHELAVESYACSVGSNKVTFIRKSGFTRAANIYCEGTNFTCGDLPVIDLTNHEWSVGIEGCSPSILKCLDKFINITLVNSLDVTDGVAPLEGHHVARLTNLNGLKVERGAVTTMPVSLIKSLPKLRSLIITGMQVTLKSNEFINTTRQLQVLQFSDVQINEIPEDAFKGLSNLKSLDMNINNIIGISKNSFRGLDSLGSLFLNTTRISKMAPGSLTHVPKLYEIHLNKNQLKELPPGLFYNLTQLGIIAIKNNIVPLKLHKHTFSNLPSLTRLTIANSRVMNLPEEFLTGCCGSLQTLDLSGNKIMSLPPAIFKGCKMLMYLFLHLNNIAVLNSGVFLPLKQLIILNLDTNYLEVLPDNLLTGLHNLYDLSVNNNLLRGISVDALSGATRLETLSLKSNQLTFNNSRYQSPFYALNNLRKLYLNDNKIDKMPYELSLLDKLTHLDLYGNNFTVLTASDWQFKNDDIKIDLRHNQIATLELNDVPKFTKTPSKYILLDDNPLRCDCELYNLTLRTRLKPNILVEPTFVLDEARCASPPHLKGELFKNISPNDLKCNLPQVYCNDTCHTCETRPANNDLVFDCDTLPNTLPNPEDFNVKFLTFKLGAAPESIANAHLELLNISNIGLHEIPFSPSKTVKAIDLTNNKLTRIPMEFLESNITLYLSNNPFECDCWHAGEIAALKASQFVKDVASIRCGDKLLTYIDPSELCNYSKGAAIAGVTFLILIVLVAAIATIIYKNSHRILALIIEKGLCPCCFVDNPDNMEYDVFVSYAHADRKYLVKLMPKLENEFGLKTCVHYRDWVVGDFIPDQINRSVEKSRKTIILLSNNFLDSGYANMEFRAAHNVALREGKSKIILILLEDVMKHENLSDALKSHLKMNTFLKWDDARFSERLQKALPLRDNKKFIWPNAQKIDLRPQVPITTLSNL